MEDVWDTLLSERPYRQAWPRAKEPQDITEQSGVPFNPEMVKAFPKIIRDLER